ncbi:unnamed protein product [Protopolystoma xenopodis]|uniref:Uncharacterized protein n=1 Tax=Protopolystoma xenopodis TaxID=117903 RepID=A0A3S5AC54_9PLAT|nr:unnamed protein product [Protopolystoma xenopodis]
MGKRCEQMEEEVTRTTVSGTRTSGRQSAVSASVDDPPAWLAPRDGVDGSEMREKEWTIGGDKRKKPINTYYSRVERKARSRWAACLGGRTRRPDPGSSAPRRRSVLGAEKTRKRYKIGRRQKVSSQHFFGL